MGADGGAPPSGETLELHDHDAHKRRAPSSAAYLFVVVELDRPLEAPGRHCLADLDEVIIGRGVERSATRSVEGSVRRLVLRVPDRRMSSTHVHLSKVLGRWVLADAGSKNGTIVAGARTQKVPLGDGDLIELGHTVLRFREAQPHDPLAAPDVRGGGQVMAHPPAGLATISPLLARELGTLAEIAASSVSVIVQGESGTGKELCAKAVHLLSARRGAFVAVNCGALPDTLIETELFGYKKGAFSGATDDRQGLVRAADGGTLFLDEIGDLPPSSQAALLRVLQEREIMPVGGTRPVPVDLRVVAASHRHLDALVAAGDFRADLLARLSGFTMVLPPLRERVEDLGLIMASLLERAAGAERAAQLTIAPDAARAILAYDWPLNVRELEKALATACVLAHDGVIEAAHLPPAVLAGPQKRERDSDAGDGDGGSEGDGAPLSAADLARKTELIALFTEHAGNVSAVARAMGKARMQVQRWMKRYGIDPDTFKRP